MGLTSSIPARSILVAENLRRVSLSKDRGSISIQHAYYMNPTCEFLYSGDKPQYLIAKDAGFTTHSMTSSEIRHVHKVDKTNDLLIETDSIIYILYSDLNIFTRPRRSGDDVAKILKEMDGYTTIA